MNPQKVFDTDNEKAAKVGGQSRQSLLSHRNLTLACPKGLFADSAVTNSGQ
jgi:hypothetical protein